MHTRTSRSDAVTDLELLQLLQRDRSTVAAALRDETAQVLATLLVSLAALQDCTDIGELHAGLNELREEVRADLGRVQALATRIQPSVLGDLGLRPALEEAAHRLEDVHGSAIGLHLGDGEFDLSPINREVVYRIIEEAMRNAAIHARARQITVRSRRLANASEIEVADNGEGFDVAATGANDVQISGLAAMRALAKAMGATVDVSSHRGAGTRVQLHFANEKKR